VNIVVESRHMEATDSIRQYVQSKTARLERFYDRLQSIEVVLDLDADQSVVEMVATANKKHTFVAQHRGSDMYACVDQCLDKIQQQVRRHKDRVRDRKGPPHSQSMPPGL
jgi:putative sigma-54 modulation protein